MQLFDVEQNGTHRLHDPTPKEGVHPARKTHIHISLPSINNQTRRRELAIHVGCPDKPVAEDASKKKAVAPPKACCFTLPRDQTTFDALVPKDCPVRVEVTHFGDGDAIIRQEHAVFESSAGSHKHNPTPIGISIGKDHTVYPEQQQFKAADKKVEAKKEEPPPAPPSKKPEEPPPAPPKKETESTKK